MEKNCSKCGQAFSCGFEAPGCWCEAVHVPVPVLQLLKDRYDNCLCRTCLEAIGSEDPDGRTGAETEPG